jgi:hypothetical protein
VLLALVQEVQAQARADAASPPFQAQARRRQAPVGAVLALVHRRQVQLQPPVPRQLRSRSRARQVRGVEAQVRAAEEVAGAVPAAPVGVVLAAPRTADRRSPRWR